MSVVKNVILRIEAEPDENRTVKSGVITSYQGGVEIPRILLDKANSGVNATNFLDYLTVLVFDALSESGCRLRKESIGTYKEVVRARYILEVDSMVGNLNETIEKNLAKLTS